jgi:hypothetical protein
MRQNLREILLRRGHLPNANREGVPCRLPTAREVPIPNGLGQTITRRGQTIARRQQGSVINAAAHYSIMLSNLTMTRPPTHVTLAFGN